jgi:hypothetical protein
MLQKIFPAREKFQSVPTREAIKKIAVERKHHQLLAGCSAAYGLVASISSLPVLNGCFRDLHRGRGQGLCQRIRIPENSVWAAESQSRALKANVAL